MKKTETATIQLPIDMYLPEVVVDEVLETYDGEDAEREMLRLAQVRSEQPTPTRSEVREMVLSKPDAAYLS